jgi:diguanylate cyclase (GGDEF)-like protein
MNKFTRPVAIYISAICGLGLAIAWFYWPQTLGEIHSHTGMVLVFSAFAVIGELLPIRVQRDGEVEEITTSVSFTFALLLALGIGPAIIAQAVATIVADLAGRKPLWKAGFNAAQYGLSLAAAGGVITLVSTATGDIPGARESVEIWLALPAAATFVLANMTLMAIPPALSDGGRIGHHVQQDLLFQLAIDGVLLAIAPIIVVAAEKSLVLVPLLAPALAAAYKTASISMEKIKLAHELREQSAANIHQAMHDSLTGLPNRSLLLERLTDASSKGSRGALMLLDIDNFKEINDTLGHHNGDLLLEQVAERLTATLNVNDVIARLGGDEFAVIMPGVSDPNESSEVAVRIRRVLGEPFFLNDEDLPLDVRASIGIVFYPRFGRDPGQLMQRADVAMYRAKKNRSGHEIYQPEHDVYSPSRLALIGELRRAIDNRELLVFYQPKADLKTGQIRGAEALVRWQHPRLGFLSPAEFIPLAEHTGLIRPLTLYVLDEALRESRRWTALGIRLQVSVNLSVQSLLDNHLPGQVRDLLAKWGVPASDLELEITESTIMSDPARAMAVLLELDGMGVALSIDDFGTGYSSLSYLKQLPVSSIKIDRSFVMNMGRSENDAVIVRSTIDLGRNLGLDVVAEGVESQDDWIKLAALQCNIAQGYYLSRPVPANDLTQWLTASGGRVRTPVADVMERTA